MSEYPEQDARTVPFQSEPKRAVVPRPVPETRESYLDLPPAPEDRHLIRNLSIGIALLAVAAIGFWMGIYYAGGAAVRALVACLLTFGVVWVLLHLNVLRQRYGGLLALGIVALLGTAMPFVEGAFRRLDDLARERLAGQAPSQLAANSVPPPPPTLATAPPAPPTIPLPPEDSPALAAADVAAPTSKTPAKASRAGSAAEKPKAPLNTKPIGTDGLLRELLVPEPPAGSGKLVRVKEDVKVDLEGRPTVIRGGTIAPFKELSDGQVTFLAGDHEISIDSSLVIFTGKTKEKTEDINMLAQQEAMNRYPKLRDTASAEHNLYMIRVAESRNAPEMKEIFADPKWPLVIAEQLAQQEGWLRADLPGTEGNVPDPTESAPGDAPAPGAQPTNAEAPSPATPGTDAPKKGIPANELPAKSDSLLPRNAPPVPQEAEPPPAK